MSRPHVSSTAAQPDSLSVRASKPAGVFTTWVGDLVTRIAIVPAARATVLASTFAAAIGAADYLTGNELSFSAFYVLAVVFGAAAGRHVGGGVVAFVATSVWVAGETAARPVSFTSRWVPVWNGSVRLLTLYFVSTLVATLSGLMVRERATSRTCPLTGLPNLRGLDEIARREIARMARTHAPLTVAFVDLDNFKAVNDRFGHAEGDGVLVAVAAAMRDSLRAADAVARVGGDEFMILLSETDAESARVALQRLYDAVADLCRDRRLPIGLSAGVVTYASPPAGVDDLFQRSDREMYAAKRAGKNTMRSIVLDSAGEVVQLGG